MFGIFLQSQGFVSPDKSHIKPLLDTNDMLYELYPHPGSYRYRITHTTMWHGNCTLYSTDRGLMVPLAAGKNQ